MNEIQFGKNRYCGPSALSAVLGITTDEAEKLLQKLRNNKRKVTGVYLYELQSVLNLFGRKATIVEPKGYTVFANLMNLREDGYYIFNVKDHFITIEVNGQHRYICDNHSKKPITFSSSSRLMMPCIRVLKVGK